jgi:hypothetical protein
MPVSVFVSTENSADDRSLRVIEGLRAAGLQVTCSPLNPALGDDPRWRDWYKTGCKSAIETADVFVAVVSDGYDSSTWMAVEFDTAWRLSRELGSPRLYLLKRNSSPLPFGFRRYEESATLLPLDPDEAAAAILAAEKIEGSRVC